MATETNNSNTIILSEVYQAYIEEQEDYSQSSSLEYIYNFQTFIQGGHFLCVTGSQRSIGSGSSHLCRWIGKMFLTRTAETSKERGESRRLIRRFLNESHKNQGCVDSQDSLLWTDNGHNLLDGTKPFNIMVAYKKENTD